jgi:hypothetical protein
MFLCDLSAAEASNTGHGLPANLTSQLYEAGRDDSITPQSRVAAFRLHVVRRKRPVGAPHRVV